MEVIYQVLSYGLQIGFEYQGLSYSPIKGPEGNIEYLLYLKNKQKPQENLNITEIINPKTIESVVLEAHNEL